MKCSSVFPILAPEDYHLRGSGAMLINELPCAHEDRQ